jgi:hypothetical protein
MYNNDKKANDSLKSHFLNLFNLASIDEEKADAEMQYLYELGKKWAISEDELLQIVQKPQEIQFVKPDTTQECVYQLYDLVCMMLIDDKIDEREVALCVKIAIKLGFKPEIVGDLVKALITAADDQLPKEVIEKELNTWLENK